MLKVLFLLVLIKNSIQQDISAITDLKTLSELPLERLLKLKTNFDPKEEELSENVISTKLKIHKNDDTPEALALQSKRKPLNRGSYEPEYHKKKEHHKDANSIFQMSVTTLAFVAFGGYLLCLIVQAIRAKNMDNGDTMAMLIRPSRPNRIRVPVRQTTPGRRPRPGNNNRYKREVWPDANPAEMYRALLMIAEGYSKYNTVDYKHYNRTVKAYL
ncbi:hypothetical protein ILUMI_06278 [Ignelater luminosus]|uniref:Uncharacterized protein n=1 Tax=Ignelater luminosus TaxID=2038154 RepID=A0A8K0D8T6_IGNLU|nr:hypothetical protein ILUMI_06278 [Ignelater luminosus]